MITNGKSASAESLAKTYGFDDKFVIAVGDVFTFAANEELYEEPSGFKRDGVDVPSIYFAWDINGKRKCLSAGALNRHSVPQSAIPQMTKSEGNISTAPLFTGAKTAQEIRDTMRGRTITLVGITSYEVPSKDNPRQTWRGKAYYWQ